MTEIVFDPIAAEPGIMANDLRLTSLALYEFPEAAARLLQIADALQALAQARDTAQAEALRLREALEKARDMFNRDAAAKKQNHDEWVAEGDLFPQMSADAYAGWKAYAVCALVLDGILTPAPAEVQL